VIQDLRDGVRVRDRHNPQALRTTPAHLPFFLLGSLAATAAPEGSDGMAFFGIGLGFALFLPVIYGVMGFISGLLGSLIYNLLAKWMGGLEFDLEDVR
jgi:hypothetical protein